MKIFNIPNWIDLNWVDCLDILVVAFVTYWIILLIKGTRAVHMIAGLAIVFIVYVISRILPMYTLNWILNSFLSSVILIIVILFQDDIRRALARMGINPLFAGISPIEEGRFFDEIVSSLLTMSETNVGALIVLERDTRLDDFIHGQTKLDARVCRELLTSIFFPLSPLHDGATVLREGKVYAAGCFLPLTERTDIDKSLGTRHRAALGISEQTDAVTMVVSEEDGSISIALDGVLQHNLNPQTLKETLTSIFYSNLLMNKHKK